MHLAWGEPHSTASLIYGFPAVFQVSRLIESYSVKVHGRFFFFLKLHNISFLTACTCGMEVQLFSLGVIKNMNRPHKDFPEEAHVHRPMLLSD